MTVIREECPEYFCLTQSTNIQEGITTNYTRHAGSNSNRKSWVPADGATQGFWHIMSAPGLHGPLPALTSLAWERSQPLVPVGGGTSCPCIVPPHQTIVGSHTLSVLKVLGPACLCSRAQENGYIPSSTNKETNGLSPSPMPYPVRTPGFHIRKAVLVKYFKRNVCKEDSPTSSIGHKYILTTNLITSFSCTTAAYIFKWISLSPNASISWYFEIWKNITDGILPQVRVTLSEKNSKLSHFLYKIRNVQKFKKKFTL